MSKTNKPVSLCFIEGEPAFYLGKGHGHYLLTYDYEEILKSVEKHVIETAPQVRPNMKNVFDFIAKQYNCCRGYNPRASVKEKPASEDSFESRFSRDITKFFDTLYKRGLTEEERKQKEAYNEKKREEYAALESIYKRRAYKRNRRI